MTSRLRAGPPRLQHPGGDRHTRLLIDGIASNLHIGVSDLKSVFPLEIERMEVVKGTNAPSQLCKHNRMDNPVNAYTQCPLRKLLLRLTI
ncbi:TonB-dependent receptor [Cystobacter fuscus DSM 2262]|uniref:TonB-dependent receptor n=1 Tax=Cystobacter fuscus (strain ATCC 25194 / DSM 2262 / NBRC 100088 / M29) TaxID=1242864 RepID=S9QKB5_CYSF2|nr:Plug domain-containing protein [Cystobacter fuscus]EPX61704.1 TonB-dependent receptor [Cystobacter fuscus DSM 2262]